MNSVVRLEVVGGVAQVQLIDREAKNTFSHALLRGLMETFQAIDSNPEIKVVVIYGYDNYFCCGGTREELLKIFSGSITFVDLEFYRVLLDCPVPTIAAMQGHAIGGGLAFACFADIMLLAEESLYSTNFMKYGFTPGMGATYMIPKKFGENLGIEMLLTAKSYQGGTLKARGTSIEVVKKKEVIPMALDLAAELSNKTRTSLVLLKQHLTHELKQVLPQVIEKELAMHRITFAEPEVKDRIETLFGN